MKAQNSILATRVGKLELANPIMTASGTFGSGKEYADFLDIARLGAVVCKSVTLTAIKGNPPPRIAETPGGMLNAIGLQNEGLDYFLRELLPPLREKAKRVVANIAGKCEEDYLALAKAFSASSVDAVEANISCPNVKEGGIAFGVDAAVAARLTRLLREKCSKPLWMKLSPNVTDIRPIAKAVADAGADALVVANTFLGMAVDVEKRRPKIANITGGLSGPCVHPMVLRLVWQCRQATDCPIVAVGGVATVEDVVAYLLSGASAVEVGMMNFVEPGIAGRLVDELAGWLEKRGETVPGLIGKLRA